eukprot:gene1265-4473_t
MQYNNSAAYLGMPQHVLPRNKEKSKEEGDVDHFVHVPFSRCNPPGTTPKNYMLNLPPSQSQHSQMMAEQYKLQVEHQLPGPQWQIWAPSSLLQQGPLYMPQTQIIQAQGSMFNQGHPIQQELIQPASRSATAAKRLTQHKKLRSPTTNNKKKQIQASQSAHILPQKRSKQDNIVSEKSSLNGQQILTLATLRAQQDNLGEPAMEMSFASNLVETPVTITTSTSDPVNIISKRAQRMMSATTNGSQKSTVTSFSNPHLQSTNQLYPSTSVGPKEPLHKSDYSVANVPLIPMLFCGTPDSPIAPYPLNGIAPYGIHSSLQPEFFNRPCSNAIQLTAGESMSPNTYSNIFNSPFNPTPQIQGPGVFSGSTQMSNENTHSTASPISSQLNNSVGDAIAKFTLRTPKNLENLISVRMTEAKQAILTADPTAKLRDELLPKQIQILKTLVADTQMRPAITRKDFIPRTSEGKLFQSLNAPDTCLQCMRVRLLHTHAPLCMACIKHNAANIKHFTTAYPELNPVLELGFYVWVTMGRLYSHSKHMCKCPKGPDVYCNCMSQIQNGEMCVPCRFIRGVYFVVKYNLWPRQFRLRLPEANNSPQK